MATHQLWYNVASVSWACFEGLSPFLWTEELYEKWDITLTVSSDVQFIVIISLYVHFIFSSAADEKTPWFFFFIYILSTYPYMKLTVFSSVRSSSYQDWYSLKILWSKKKWKNHVLEDVDKYCKCRGSKKCLHVSGVSLSGALIFCLPSGIGKFPKDYLIVLYFTYKKIVALTVLESAAMYVFPCLSLSGCHF